MRTKVDINNWKRKLAYETFSSYRDPYIGIVTKINITNLINFCKQNKISFYGCMTYFVLKSMNEIDAFKYGFGKEDGNEFVYKYDSLAVTATVINNDNELNFTRYIEYDEDISNFLIEFSKAIDDASNNVPYYKILGLKNMNKINITCIPWIAFSNFKDAINLNEKNSKPKICWGKYYLDDDRYLIDISLLVNHAFQDGYHMGLFFNNLQENIYNLKIDKSLVKVR